MTFVYNDEWVNGFRTAAKMRGGKSELTNQPRLQTLYLGVVELACLLDGGVVRLVDSLHLIVVQLGCDLSLSEARVITK